MAFKINDLTGMDLFPIVEEGQTRHFSNICILVVDTMRRYVYVLYNNIYV